MAGAALRGVLIGAAVLLAGAAAADEPVLPAPRPVATPMVWPLGFERPDPYAVWHNYAVDRQGRFRPLVSPSYGGLRYVATGEPYPWMAEHTQYVRPVVSSMATFAGPPQPPQPPLVIVEPAPVPRWAPMPYAEE